MKRKVVCDQCGIAFETSLYNQKRCSKKECMRKYKASCMIRWNKLHKKIKVIEKVCAMCGKEFLVRRSRGKGGIRYCSTECSKESSRQSGQRWYQANSEAAKASSKNWCDRNRKRVNQRANDYYKIPEKKLIIMLRSTLHRRIRADRSVRTKGMISYSMKELREHLESLWLPGMSWKNYGLHGWHIDHIKPLSRFNFFNSNGSVNEKEVRSAMSLKNLQPLWAVDNWKKKDKYEEAVL